MKLKNIREINFKNIVDAFWREMFKRYEIIFVAVFVLILIIGGLMIYKYAFVQSWATEKKTKYLQEKEKITSLNVQKMESVIKNINDKKTTDENEMSEVRNIFIDRKAK